MHCLLVTAIVCPHVLAVANYPDNALPGVPTALAQGYDITHGDLQKSSKGMIFEWTWDQGNPIILNGKTYAVPDQLTVAAIELCLTAEVQTTQSAASYSEMLRSEATSRSSGASEKIDIGIDLEGVKVGDSLQNSLMFGKGSASSSYKFQQQQKRSKSSKAFCSATVYKSQLVDSAIDDKVFSTYFKKDVKQFASNPTRDAAFTFLDQWGTHVMASAEMGGSYSRNLYFEEETDISTVSSFTDKQKSSGVDFFFIHSHKSSDQQTSTTNYDGSNRSVFMQGTETIGGNPNADSPDEFCASIEDLSWTPTIAKFEKMTKVWHFFDRIDGVTTADARKMEGHFLDLFKEALECGHSQCGQLSICSWGGSSNRMWSPPCNCLGLDEVSDYPDEIGQVTFSSGDDSVTYALWPFAVSESDYLLDPFGDCFLWNDGKVGLTPQRVEIQFQAAVGPELIDMEWPKTDLPFRMEQTGFWYGKDSNGLRLRITNGTALV